MDDLLIVQVPVRVAGWESRVTGAWAARCLVDDALEDAQQDLDEVARFFFGVEGHF